MSVSRQRDASGVPWGCGPLPRSTWGDGPQPQNKRHAFNHTAAHQNQKPLLNPRHVPTRSLFPLTGPSSQSGNGPRLACIRVEKPSESSICLSSLHLRLGTPCWQVADAGLHLAAHFQAVDAKSPERLRHECKQRDKGWPAFLDKSSRMDGPMSTRFCGCTVRELDLARRDELGPCAGSFPD